MGAWIGLRNLWGLDGAYFMYFHYVTKGAWMGAWNCEATGWPKTMRLLDGLDDGLEQMGAGFHVFSQIHCSLSVYTYIYRYT